MDGFRRSLYSDVTPPYSNIDTSLPPIVSHTKHKQYRPLCQTTEPVIYPSSDSEEEDNLGASITIIDELDSNEEAAFIDKLKKGTVWYDKPDEVQRGEAKEKQKRCLQNLALHSLSFMCVYTPYMTLQHLHINLMSEAWAFLAVLVSCIAAPVVVRLLGYKRTMIVSYGTNLLFVVSNLIPSANAVFPTLLFVGLASGPFYTAQGSYISLLASEYSDFARTDLRATTCAFFGLFYVFYHASRIFGRPLAFYLLDWNYLHKYINQTTLEEEELDHLYSLYHNGTYHRTQCGLNFCPDHRYVSDIPQAAYSQKAVYIFTVIYFLSCATGLIIKVFFVDDKRPLGGVPAMSLRKLAVSTIHMHCKETFLMLLPLIIYTGLEHAFIFEDYLHAFVRCNIGFRNVGPVILTLAWTQVLCTLVIGFLQKYPKCRFSLMELAFLMNLILLCLLKTKSSADWGKSSFFLYALFWGISDAIWQTSTCATISLSFTHCRSPAFATFRLWQTIASGVAVSLNKYICVGTYIPSYIVILLLATICFTIMERRYKKKSAVPYVDLYTPVEPGNDHVKLYIQRLLSL